MTFGKVIESMHICSALNPWLIIGIAGCVTVAWFLNKVDSKWLPVERILFVIAFGITVKGVWNIDVETSFIILGIEIILFAISNMISNL